MVSLGATVWFSENEIGLGKPLLREIGSRAVPADHRG